MVDQHLRTRRLRGQHRQPGDRRGRPGSAENASPRPPTGAPFGAPCAGSTRAAARCARLAA